MQTIINKQSVTVDSFITPFGLNLSTVPNITPDEGRLAYDPTSNVLYYADGTSFNALAAASSTLMIANYGSTPNVKGMTLTGAILNLEPASATFPGGVSTSAQSFSGTKTFDNSVILPTLSSVGIVHNDAFGVLSTSLIVDADVAALANISDTKLATISTIGKVSNSATTATSSNVANTIALRDVNGDFSMRNITNVDMIVSGNINMSLLNSTAISGNIYKNGIQFLHNFGTRNTFTGINSGNYSMTGTDNTVYGYTSADLTTAGSRNCSFGSLSFDAATTASDNCCFGYNTLTSIISGNGNSAFGSGCLTNVVAGNRNTGYGFNSLNSVTNGDDNIAIGYNAGETVTIGSRNVLINSTVSNNLTSGNDNIFISANAGSPSESGAIRFGISGTQTACFIAGINGILPSSTLLPMFINPSGQMGTQSFATGIMHSTAGVISSSLIVNADISASAAIVDTKLATISTALKVSNSATTATSSNVNNAIVSRDFTGDFATNGISANNVTAGVVNSTGYIIMPLTTDLSTGTFQMNGTKILHAYGGSTTTNFFVGKDAGNYTMTAGANDNNSLGYLSLSSLTSGANNSAFGSQSLRRVTTGSSNTGFGVSTLAFVTTASSNTAVGHNSLGVNTASSNTAVGYNSLAVNTTGIQNAAFGYNALAANLTGGSCTAVGYNALVLSTGNNNTAVGSNALDSNTSGGGNTAVGTLALTTVTTGSNCTAVGLSALRDNTANNNTAVGFSALIINTSGTQNTAIGYNTLALMLTGTGNTAVGNASLSAATGSNLTAVGALALTANTSGLSNVAVGNGALKSITTNSNSTAVGDAALSVATGGSNTAFGYQAGIAITSGASNIIIGASAGGVLTTGSNNIYIGLSANTSADANVCKIGQIRGISTSSATGIAVLIDVNGQLGTVSSTRDTKMNIIAMDSYENSLIVKNLKPRRFDYIKSKGEYQQYGLIVDEVQGICDDLVAKDENGEACTIYYQHLPMILLAEVQRLQAIIERAGLV